MGDDEAETVKTPTTYRKIMGELIQQHRGRVIDSPGDNILAEFGSVVDAVQCSVAAQNEFKARNAELPENRRMEFRIGVNLGGVIEEEDRIYGDGVNIAARLEGLAEGGGICISKTNQGFYSHPDPVYAEPKFLSEKEPGKKWNSNKEGKPMGNVYERLRQRLDELATGYPATQSGVEIRILKRLFTEAEAEFFLKLSPLPEAPEHVAGRLGLEPGETAALMERMAVKGIRSATELYLFW